MSLRCKKCFELKWQYAGSLPYCHCTEVVAPPKLTTQAPREWWIDENGVAWLAPTYSTPSVHVIEHSAYLAVYSDNEKMIVHCLELAKERDAVVKERDDARSDAAAFIEGSAEWEDEARVAKRELAAVVKERDDLRKELEIANRWQDEQANHAQRFLAERDALAAQLAEAKAETASNRKHWGKLFDDSVAVGRKATERIERLERAVKHAKYLLGDEPRNIAAIERLERADE